MEALAEGFNSTIDTKYIEDIGDDEVRQAWQMQIESVVDMKRVSELFRHRLSTIVDHHWETDVSEGKDDHIGDYTCCI